MIPYGRQSVDDADVAAVIEVLRGDWLTQGPAVERFESAVAECTGARYAVAFVNGTAALHAAMFAAEIGAGDVVATSALSFVASANCARYVGADVVFVDIDPATLNLDVTAVPLCDVLVAVHYAGLPVDLTALSTRPRIVIEDAAHALGATTPDGPVGSCVASDMCMFSFHPVKSVTSGEGGAVTTNSSMLADRMRVFRNHGMRKKAEGGGWYYEVEVLGYNYRLTDIHAALGASQLTKLEGFVDRRNQLADRYRSLLAQVDLILPPAAPEGWRHSYHLFPIRVDRRRKIYDALRVDGIATQVHYVPIHHHPIYRDLAAELPETDAAYDRLLSIPLFPDLSQEQQDHVVARLCALL